MLVSIGIPTYNRSHYLSRAIRSVLAQTYTNIELIVSDDCSTDDTEHVVRSFADARIHYYKSVVRLGVPGNWNVCVKRARGEFFALLPDDDEYTPDFVKTMAELLRSDADISFVQCALFSIDENSQVLDAIRANPAPFRLRGEDAIKWHLSTFACYPAALLFRRSTMVTMGLWREDYLDDWAFIVKLAYRHGFTYTPDLLSANRSHAGQFNVQLNLSGRDGTLDRINHLSDIFGLTLPVTPGLLALRAQEERRLSRVCVREALQAWWRGNWAKGNICFRRAHQLFPLALIDPLVLADISRGLRWRIARFRHKDRSQDGSSSC